MSAQTPEQPKSVPTVLIVGGGLGGLMLGQLLEQINVPYHIFERANELRALGSVMTLGPNIIPLFEQLGLMEEINKFSLPVFSLDMYGDDMKKVGAIDLTSHKAVSGNENLLFARPQLYELMKKQVPASKITLGKKVVRHEEKDGKVIIHCSDNTKFEGDILVGADGAYSGVRQSLYKQMDEQNILPKNDLESLSVGYVSMVGVAKPSNPEKYPQLKDNFAHYSQVLGPDSRSWGVFSVPGNQICFVLSSQLSTAEAKDQAFRNSEWGPEANDAMLKEFYEEPCPWGGKMGDVFDETPKNLISKVFLEEKLFKTWYHSRTALIGDACHKMLPGAGQGAVNAMQDAVVLANCIYNMPDSSTDSITAAFQEYYKQRFSRAEMQFERSSSMTKTISGQTWVDRVLRNVMLNYVPNFITQMSFMKTFEYRPQIAWLPLAENRGTVKVLPQEGVRKLLEAKAEAI
ncbi:hypothetical protein BC939DRAFT_467209 [Gamsiella multidivaricata]|uniref:uncharacterized protein n=1 Tax=Gamsiella multidivaricata TaxID=101098 RepID=UPI00221F594B|nr:uncharacterized protein BC939DRAFT_467209 [Gamsiella multidivaricata]KAG0354060.1 hypothetical protein BGZ54_001870 [Gamsiella multidivaricata]KAI7817038.1 hypothetical protein BC939DRAFT_467209 [Gamsiella multidivaricata]